MLFIAWICFILLRMRKHHTFRSSIPSHDSVLTSGIREYCFVLPAQAVMRAVGWLTSCGASYWYERYTGLWGITLTWTSHRPVRHHTVMNITLASTFLLISHPFSEKPGGIKTALAYCQSSGDLLRILNDACQVPSTRELGRAACKITGRKEEILRLLALCWLTFTGKDAFKK